MLSRPKLMRAFMSAALVALPSLVLSNLAYGQIIFSDDDFQAADYTTSGAGIQDIRFNFNYNNFDVFGDGFLTVTIPNAPRGGGPGVFLSANNNSLVGGQASFASVSPLSSLLNVGNGTSNEDFVLRVDVFNSSGAGIDNGSGTVTQTGTTNHGLVLVNQANTTVQVANLNAPGATGSLAGQGLGLAVTADSGASDDYVPFYGGARYADRALADTVGQAYSQTTQPTVHTGLLGKYLDDYWETQGFEFNVVTPDVNDNLNRFTGDALFFAPDPANTAGYLPDGSGVDKSLYLDAFPEHNDPLHYAGGGVTPPAFLAPNTALFGGVPYNQWATHEVYWVDGELTYVINDVPIIQFTPDADGLNGDDTVFSPFSSAGTAVLGFWDRFSSIAVSPDGANFIVYDNLEVAVAGPGDVPDIQQYLIDNGYTIAASTPGDFDGDGDVDGRDFLEWQRGNSPNGTPGVSVSAADLAEWQAAYNGGALSAVTAVPEPISAMLMMGVAGCGLLARRRS